ncbi:MAG: rod shape-determining protein MreC [Flavobacteriaceae bacterium]|nr:rod shape-determining protein MreC [Flavobacteriaceae bacterium]
MQQIIFFFIRNKNFLLFALLFLISITLTVNSHSYHKSKFVNSANFFSGGIYSIKSDITDYFDLRKQNEVLAQENEQLRALLLNSKIDSVSIDSTHYFSKYEIYDAQVINNNFSKTKNHITLNKGSSDSLKVDMGVISSEGIVGIIHSVSNNYASVQSVLNTNSQVVAKFKKSNHFGTLIWDTKAPNIVQLTEIPRIAPVALGDTIVTDGKSTIFPEGIPIGKVRDFQRDPDEDYYDINVELFSDMTSLKHVYAVKNKKAPEIKELETQVENEEQ